jgi:hypothetical protein
MKSLVLKKIVSLDSETKQAVTNVIISKGHMFVSRLHEVFVYKECLPIIAGIILKEEHLKKANVDSNMECSAHNLPIKNLSEGMMLSISLGKNALHVFNES